RAVLVSRPERRCREFPACHGKGFGPRPEHRRHRVDAAGADLRLAGPARRSAGRVPQGDRICAGVVSREGVRAVPPVAVSTKAKRRAFVELKIEGQPKRIEFEMPEGEVRPAELLPVLRQFSNVMVEAAEAAATEPISCTKGCGACCRQLVPIREMEARRLAAF